MVKIGNQYIDNRKALAIGAGALLVGGGITAFAISRKRKSAKKSAKRKSKSKSRTKTSRSYSRYKQRKPYTAGKRPDTSRRRIRFTKKGQPYVIVYRNINGTRRKMAKFITKKSAKMSRRRVGGRY